MDVTGNLDNTLGTQEARRQFRNEYHSFVLKQCQRQCSKPEMVEDLADYVILKTEHQYRNKPLPYRCEAYLASQVCLAYARYADNPEALSSVVERNRPVYETARREESGREKPDPSWRDQAKKEEKRPEEADLRSAEPSVTSDVRAEELQGEARMEPDQIPGRVQNPVGDMKRPAEEPQRSAPETEAQGRVSAPAAMPEGPAPQGNPAPMEAPRQETAYREAAPTKKPWWEAPEWNSAPAVTRQGPIPQRDPAPMEARRQEVPQREAEPAKRPWWEAPEWNSSPAPTLQGQAPGRTPAGQEVPQTDAVQVEAEPVKRPWWEAPEWNSTPTAVPQRQTRRRQTAPAPLQAAQGTDAAQADELRREAQEWNSAPAASPQRQARRRQMVPAPLSEAQVTGSAQVQSPEPASQQEVPEAQPLPALQPQPEDLQMEAAQAQALAEVILQEAEDAAREEQPVLETRMDAAPEPEEQSEDPSPGADTASPVQPEPLAQEQPGGQTEMTPETLAAAVAAAVVQALGKTAPPAVQAQPEEIPVSQPPEAPPRGGNEAQPKDAAAQPGKAAAPAATKPEQKAPVVVMEAILDERDTELWTPDSQKETTVQNITKIRNQAPPEEKRLIPLTMLNMLLGIGSVASLIFLLMCLDILPRVF